MTGRTEAGAPRRPAPAEPAEEPPSGALPARLLTRLSTTAAHWVDGGPIDRWSPVHSRFAKAVALPGQQVRVVFTQIGNPPRDATIGRWLDHQRLLVVPKPQPSDALVFWRLAVRQRAFAIDAHPRPDAQSSLDRFRRVSRRVRRLHVTFGFLPGEPIPGWVVRDKDEPVFLGLPEHFLVPTRDPVTSLAALIATARIRPQVHEILPMRTPDRTPADRVSGDRAPGDRAPTGRASADRAPVGHAPGDRAPVGHASGDRAPNGPASAEARPTAERPRAAGASERAATRHSPTRQPRMGGR